MIIEKADVKRVNDVTTAINLCHQDVMIEEMKIIYTYKDLRRQMMILDIGAPVSLAGVSWIS